MFIGSKESFLGVGGSGHRAHALKSCVLALKAASLSPCLESPVPLPAPSHSALLSETPNAHKKGAGAGLLGGTPIMQIGLSGGDVWWPFLFSLVAKEPLITAQRRRGSVLMPGRDMVLKHHSGVCSANFL